MAPRNTVTKDEYRKNIVMQNYMNEGTSGNNNIDNRWSYYDRETVDGTSVKKLYFTQATGQGGKSLADSNYPSSGNFPTSQKMHIRDISCYIECIGLFTPAELASLKELCTQTILTFNVNNKAPIVQVPLSHMLNSCFNVVGYDATTGGLYVNDTVQSGHYKLSVDPKHAVVIAAQTTWNLQLDFVDAQNLVESLADKVKIKLSINGRLERTT